MHPVDDRILKVLALNNAGLAASDIARLIAEGSADPIAERTLKRRLTALANEDRIKRSGKGPGTRYYPIDRRDQTSELPSPPSVGSSDDVSSIPMTDDGAAVLSQVTRPLAARKLTGYNEHLLRDYEPQRDSYLDADTREHLWRIGQNVASAAPAGTFARQIFERLLIDLAWSSSRLEGNTYSRLDTERLLQEGERAAGKDAREAQMILNHKKAIELLVDGAESIGFNRFTLLNLHAALSENLVGNPEDEGRVRRAEAGITGTTYIPLSLPQKLEELFDLLLAKADLITDPFEQAFFAMVHIPYLQPFIDVNKRTSRLAANIPLIKRNLCPLSFVDVPEQVYVHANVGVYELNNLALLRDLFVWAYDRSATRYRIVQESVPQPDPLRLRYRPQLGALVRDLVTGERTWRDISTQETSAELGVAAKDREAFLALLELTMAGLHEGNFARYGLRPSEFHSWVMQKT